MIDKEKVIKGLECCIEWDSCNKCPYETPNEYDIAECTLSLHTDALALLKEQEPVKPRYTPPKSIYSWECGVCAEPFDRIANYCPKCGRRLKWE